MDRRRNRAPRLRIGAVILPMKLGKPGDIGDVLAMHPGVLVSEPCDRPMQPAVNPAPLVARPVVTLDRGSAVLGTARRCAGRFAAITSGITPEQPCLNASSMTTN